MFGQRQLDIAEQVVSLALQGVRVDLTPSLPKGQHAQPQGTEGIVVPLAPLLLGAEFAKSPRGR